MMEVNKPIMVMSLVKN